MIPKNRRPTHPGAMLLEEFIIPMELTQTALAKHLRWTYTKLNEIINGKRGISTEAALTLSDVFGTTPELWLNLQNNYDLWGALQSHKKYPKLKKAA